MLRRTKTYWLLMALFTLTGVYSFWLFFQWNSIGGEPGSDLDLVRRNAYASLLAGFICLAGVIALTVAHNKKSRRDI